jgi:O-antigen ligase
MIRGWGRARELAKHPLAPWFGLGAVAGLAVAVKPTLVVLAAGAAVVTIFGVRSPPLLVLLMFLGMLFDRLGVTGQKLGDFPVTASKLTVLGSLALWVLHVGTSSGVPAWRPHRVLGGMLAVIGTTALTVAIANTMAEGKFDLFGLAMMLVLVGVTYAILAEAPLQGLYRAMALAFAVTLAIAVRGGSGGERGAGPMGDPNEWATMVLLVTPLLLGGLADDDRAGAPYLRVALVGLAPLAVLRSESRAALAVGVLTAPGIAWLLRRRRGELLVCAGGAAVAAPFVVDLSAMFGRVAKLLANARGGAVEQDTSFEERSELFRQGLDLFRDHWLVGAGPGNFAAASGFVSHEGTLRPPHNSYLEIASEQGVVGLAGVAVFFVTVAITLREGWFGARSERARNRVGGAGLGLVAVALMAATLGLITFSMAYLVLGFALAVAAQAQEDRVHA